MRLAPALVIGELLSWSKSLGLPLLLLLLLLLVSDVLVVPSRAGQVLTQTNFGLSIQEFKDMLPTV
jgi:hypothetical protein